MTELAYMTREDWAQSGTAMKRQSAAIRDWLGPGPWVIATTDRRKYAAADSADREFVGYLTGPAATPTVVDLRDLNGLHRRGKVLNRPLVVLHPYKENDCDLVLDVAATGSVPSMFVVLWSPHDMARAWLDGVGGLNLDTYSALPTPDPTQLEAAHIWVNEQYNGLSGGNGKAAVVQLLRAFTDAGYSLDADTWLRTYFAAGGNFRHATAIAKVIEEMRSGRRHRIDHRYRTNIVDVLRERATNGE